MNHTKRLRPSPTAADVGSATDSLEAISMRAAPIDGGSDPEFFQILRCRGDIILATDRVCDNALVPQASAASERRSPWGAGNSAELGGR